MAKGYINGYGSDLCESSALDFQQIMTYVCLSPWIFNSKCS